MRALSGLEQGIIKTLTDKTLDEKHKKPIEELYLQYHTKKNTHGKFILKTLIKESAGLTFEQFFRQLELINYAELLDSEDGTFSNNLKRIYTATTPNGTITIGPDDINTISKLATMFGSKKLSQSRFSDYALRKNKQLEEKADRKIRKTLDFDIYDLYLKNRAMINEMVEKEIRVKKEEKLEKMLDNIHALFAKTKHDTDLEFSPERTILKQLAPDYAGLNKLPYDKKTPKDILKIMGKTRVAIDKVTEHEWFKLIVYTSVHTYRSRNTIESIFDDLALLCTLNPKQNFLVEGSEVYKLTQKPELNLIEIAQILAIKPDLLQLRKEFNNSSAMNYSLHMPKNSELSENITANPVKYIIKKFLKANPKIPEEITVNEEEFAKYDKILRGNREYLKHCFKKWSFRTELKQNPEIKVYMNAIGIESMRNFELMITPIFALLQRKIVYFEQTGKTPKNVKLVESSIDSDASYASVIGKFLFSYMPEYIPKESTQNPLIKEYDQYIKTTAAVKTFGLIDEKQRKLLTRLNKKLKNFYSIDELTLMSEGKTETNLDAEFLGKFLAIYNGLKIIYDSKDVLEKLEQENKWIADKKPLIEYAETVIKAKYFDRTGMYAVFRQDKENIQSMLYVLQQHEKQIQ